MKITSKPLIIVLAIALIFASVGLPVGAQGSIENGTTTVGEAQTSPDGGINTAVPGGPGFIMIHPTAFVPMYSTQEYAFNIGGGALYNTGSSDSYYEAAVNLPHGAKITKVVVYYYDNSPTKDVWVLLAAISMDDSILPAMAWFESSGADSNNRVMENTTISPDIIDNQSYAYWIEVGLPGGQSTNLMIRGIRIDFSYPVNLPLIKR